MQQIANERWSQYTFYRTKAQLTSNNIQPVNYHYFSPRTFFGNYCVVDNKHNFETEVELQTSTVVVRSVCIYLACGCVIVIIDRTSDWRTQTDPSNICEYEVSTFLQDLAIIWLGLIGIDLGQNVTNAWHVRRWCLWEEKFWYQKFRSLTLKYRLLV